MSTEGKRKRFLNAVPEKWHGEAKLRTLQAERRWERYGLVWRTLATHPESVYSGRNADR